MLKYGRSVVLGGAIVATACLAMIVHGPKAGADEGGDQSQIRPFEELVVAEQITTDEMEYLLHELDAIYFWRIDRAVQITVEDDGGGPLFIVGESRLGDESIRSWGEELFVGETLTHGGLLHVGFDDAVLKLTIPDMEETPEVVVEPGTFLALGTYMQDSLPASCDCNPDTHYACCWRDGLNLHCECIPHGQPANCHAGGPSSENCWISKKGCDVKGCSDGTYACCKKNPIDGRWTCLCVSSGNCDQGGPGATGCGRGKPQPDDEFHITDVVDFYIVAEL